jgi:hypothetical protein
VRRISILLWPVIVCLALTASASAQMPMTTAEAANATSALDAPPAKTLNCYVEKFSPVLDFALRFQVGFIIHCRLSVFEGRKVTGQTYLRVTPTGRAPVLLSAAYGLPAIAPDTPASTRLATLKQEVGISGALSVGEGDYFVEVLVTDDRSRVCRKSWKMHVAADHSQRRAHLTIPPLTVEPFDRTSWEIPPSQKNSAPRLTILLDAAPIHSYGSSLRAWDRSFLLESLYSLLRQVPFKSVRLVAFSLDQQREIYRRDSFDGTAFAPLSHALREMETATISVQALKSHSSTLFLSTLANQELAADNSPDAIIFLGPNSRVDAEIGADWLPAWKSGSPPFFYFEYFRGGSPFPDSVQRLMTVVSGKTLLFHSPAELDQSIQKMLAQLKQE